MINVQASANTERSQFIL